MMSAAARGRATFQTKFFLAALSAASIALAVAGLLFATTIRSQMDARIEATLVAEARMAADLLTRGVPLATVAELDEEADRLGALLRARVTFIASDGRVVGDSAESNSDRPSCSPPPKYRRLTLSCRPPGAAPCALRAIGPLSTTPS